MLLVCATGALPGARLASAWTEAVVVLDFEGIVHNPEAAPTRMYGAAVKVWLQDITRPP